MIDEGYRSIPATRACGNGWVFDPVSNGWIMTTLDSLVLASRPMVKLSSKLCVHK